MTNYVLHEIEAERYRQRAKGWTDDHDDLHGVGHLIGLAGEYASAAPLGGDYDREKIVQAATLLVAAIEALDRREEAELSPA